MYVASQTMIAKLVFGKVCTGDDDDDDGDRRNGNCDQCDQIYCTLDNFSKPVATIIL